MMIEVFKTNIDCPDKAKQLVEQLQENFMHCKANFDLDDCDRILRIVNDNGNIAAVHFIDWLKKFECNAEPLPDH